MKPEHRPARQACHRRPGDRDHGRPGAPRDQEPRKQRPEEELEHDRRGDARSHHGGAVAVAPGQRGQQHQGRGQGSESQPVDDRVAEKQCAVTAPVADAEHPQGARRGCRCQEQKHDRCRGVGQQPERHHQQQRRGGIGGHGDVGVGVAAVGDQVGAVAQVVELVGGAAREDPLGGEPVTAVEVEQGRVAQRVGEQADPDDQARRCRSDAQQQHRQPAAGSACKAARRGVQGV